MERVRVLVADDEDTVLDAVQALMESDPTVELVGTASDAEGAIRIASQEHPDVALVDVRMPLGGGPRASRELSLLSPPPKVIAFSVVEDSDTVRQMLRSGASGYLLKGSPAREILDVIHRSAVETALPASPAPETAHTYAEFVRRNARESTAWQERRERVRGLVDGQCLRIEFQPIFATADRAVVGMEALARFDTSPRMPPDAWFAEADAVGWLRGLELAAMRASLHDLARIPPRAFMALNLSPATATSAELREIIEVVPADRIVLEITEHSPVSDYDVLRRALEPLRELGVRVAIDDVGAGFASLRHVLRLDPDLLKLDMALTRAIDADTSRHALVVALAAFASQVGAGVVEEGVETQEELSALEDAGVQFAQGFLLARPGPLPANSAGRTGSDPSSLLPT